MVTSGTLHFKNLRERASLTEHGLAFMPNPDVPQDPIFTPEYARLYDTDMVEAIPRLHSDWQAGLQTGAVRMRESGAKLILDAGTGTGRMPETILREHPEAQVVAFDRSTGFLEVAKSRLGSIPEAKDRVILWQGDLTQKLPFEDCTFDGVTSHWTVQYLSRESQMHLFRELKRVLKPGGKFYMNVSYYPFKFFVPVFCLKIWLFGDRRERQGLKRIWKHMPVVRSFNKGYRTGQMYLPKVREVHGMHREAGFKDSREIGYRRLPLLPLKFVSFIEATA